MRAMLNKVLEDIDTDTDESASSSESSQLQYVAMHIVSVVLFPFSPFYRLVPVCPSSEAVFKGSRSRYFMGEGRSNSPFGLYCFLLFFCNSNFQLVYFAYQMRKQMLYLLLKQQY